MNPPDKNKILVVDDDAANLTELINILQSNYTVFAAKDGITALYVAQWSMPDLILLDVIMPDMSGFEVFNELKKTEGTKDIPVIFITGLNTAGNESKGLAIGAADYIHKPFDPTIVSLRVLHQIQIINLKKNLEAAVNTAELANRAKSDFLAKMSHEIRTPLNAVLGISEANLHSTDIAQNTRDDFAKVYSSGKLLLSIVNDLLDFSKIEAGKMDIIPVQYELASLINDSIQHNIHRINDKPIKFDLQMEDNLPTRLMGDDLRIAQIINNLLSNAFKYTDEGIVILSFDTIAKPDGNDLTLVIRVRDTGRGMTDEQLKTLFNEYSRFDEKNNRAVEGTGLGLAITKHLVNLMDGEITAESKPGEGTLFVVKLPQSKISDDVMDIKLLDNLRRFHMNFDSQKDNMKVIRHFMPYGSVLVVDDMESNLYVATRLMKLYKLKLETAMSGREAVNKIKVGKTYDIIFMDHMMPDMDGIETTKKLRGLGYEGIIVALTANAIVGQAEMLMECGFDEFMSKPIDIHQLDIVLNRYIRDKRAQKIVYVVNDDIDFLSASASQLELKYEVMTMASVEKVFHLLGKKQPDIILINKNIADINESEIINKLEGIPAIFYEGTIEPTKLLGIVEMYFNQ
jgi:signal transduction histidine kinase